MILERFFDNRVIVKVGDITAENTDAIVNAANTSLLGGGGVDGAIHDRGGPRILEECERIRDGQYPNGLPAGEAVITTAGDLPSKYVIHTVGPIYGRHNGDEPALLRNAYQNSLALAASKGLRTIAFPSISTGAYSYPKDKAAKIASRAITDSLAEYSIVSEVRFVFFSDSDAQMFLRHCSF